MKIQATNGQRVHKKVQKVLKKNSDKKYDLIRKTAIVILWKPKTCTYNFLCTKTTVETGIMYYYVELVSRPIGCHGNFISSIYLSTTYM